MDKNLISLRHGRSEKDFPELHLEEDEYVEYAFTRAKICFVIIWSGVALGLIFSLIFFLVGLSMQSSMDDMGKNFMLIILFALVAVALLAGLIATIIFKGNKLFITNKRAIQFVVSSPVVSSKNMIDLSSVEDVSFRQNNIFQKIFNYGTIRLSTVGDETTYTFTHVLDPGDELNNMNQLVRNAKNNKNKKDSE